MTNQVNFIKVQSSNIQEVGYLNNDLYVRYASGTYVYEGVEKSLYEGLVSSESKGKYMNEHIKGMFKYRKI